MSHFYGHVSVNSTSAGVDLNHEGFIQTSQGLSNGNQIQGEFSGQQNVGPPRGSLVKVEIFL